MFNIGDTVDVKDRKDLSDYGKITQLLPDEKAVVHFRLRCKEKERNCCDKCRFPGLLSICGNTGEVVCMRSGCGHGHGFEERDEIIPVAKLINISEKRRDEEREKLLGKLKALLAEGMRKNLIMANQNDEVMRLLTP